MTGEELKKLIQKSQKEIDAKIRLIDELMSADISGNNYVKLNAAKKDLTAFRSKVSNESEWRKSNYYERENGQTYILKSGGIGGYTPESYVKKVVDSIDYKNEKSPYKPIVEKYNQNVASESTKGSTPVLNEAALGLTEKAPQSNTTTTRKVNTALTGAGSGMNTSDEKPKIVAKTGDDDKKTTASKYKEGDKIELAGKVYTYKENFQDKGALWIRTDSDSKGNDAKTGTSLRVSDMDKFISEGNAKPIKSYKYQGKDYRLNPNDNKWYESNNDKEPASAQVVERLNELSKSSGEVPKKEAEKVAVTEKRTQADIDKGGEFRLGLNKPKTPLAGDVGAKEKTWRDWYEEIMPKDNKVVPPAAKQVASKKAAGTGVTPREQQNTTGITTGTTIKDALGKLSTVGDTPLAKQSEYYDPESYKAGNQKVGVLGNAIKAGAEKFGGVAEYLPDVFKATLGLAGANEKLPEFKTPQYFTDYETRLREQSTQGLTDAEYAQSMRSADRGYAYDVNNISNFAGGRPGVALANLGRAANTLQDAYGNINVADAQMQRQNLQQYGGVVNTRLGLDQNAFNQKFQVAAQNKMAGAQLAADAMANISARRDFNESYGKGSTYAKYQESLLAGQEYQNEILQYQLQNPVPLPEYNPNVMNQNTVIPNYQNWYMQPQTTQAPR